VGQRKVKKFSVTTYKSVVKAN